jgi:hypothetical protein
MPAASIADLDPEAVASTLYSVGSVRHVAARSMEAGASTVVAVSTLADDYCNGRVPKVRTQRGHRLWPLQPVRPWVSRL